jgi:putative endonuclease
MRDVFVYLLSNRPRGTLYGFTKRYGVTRLVWFEATPNIAAAIQHEKTIKHWPRAWKINLIERQNPDWRDLFDDIAG